MNPCSNNNPVESFLAPLFFKTDFPKFLDNTVDAISICKQKLFESINIPPDYGRLKALTKIQAKILDYQKGLKNLSSDSLIPCIFMEIERLNSVHKNSKNQEDFDKVVTLYNTIAVIEEMRKSNKYNEVKNNIAVLLEQVRYSIECLNKTAFNVQKILTTDFEASINLLKESFKFHKHKIPEVIKFLTNEEKVKFLTNIKKEIKSDKISIEFLEDPKILQTLQTENECEMDRPCRKRLLDRKISEFKFIMPRISEVSNKASKIHKHVKDSIENIEKLEKLKKEDDVVTLQIDTSEGSLEVYLPKANLDLSKVLKKTSEDNWKNGKLVPVDAKNYTKEVVQEFFNFLATEFPPQFTSQNVMALIYIADRFDVPTLIPLCLNFIKKNANLYDIPELFQMGLDMKRKELNDCCDEVVNDFTLEPSSFVASILRKKTNINHDDEFRILISRLLSKGVETNQKETIWFALRHGMKKGIFYDTAKLMKVLENEFPAIKGKVSKEQLLTDLTQFSCKKLIEELSKLPLTTEFKKDQGQIEFQKIPLVAPSLLNLNSWIPLTLNIKEDVKQKDYFDFIEKLISQKIQINVTMPEKWKEKEIAKNIVIVVDPGDEGLYGDNDLYGGHW